MQVGDTEFKTFFFYNLWVVGILENIFAVSRNILLENVFYCNLRNVCAFCKNAVYFQAIFLKLVTDKISNYLTLLFAIGARIFIAWQYIIKM